MEIPNKIIILSGKRKSGKDYFANLLIAKFGKLCDLVTLSQPLKRKFAKIHGLDYKRLLDSSSYKEKFREDMIKWGESERSRDPGVFCRLASENCIKPVWIVTDARRITDVTYFENNFNGKTILVRIFSSEKTRERRGWKFFLGIDDAASECALDHRTDWDYVVNNDEEPNENAPEVVCDKLCKICQVDS